MKVRAITIGISLSSQECSDLSLFQQKITTALSHVQAIATELTKAGYSVQTVRIALNSFEDWLLPAVHESSRPLIDLVQALEQVLATVGVELCSFGNATTAEGIAVIPDILTHSRVSCSVSLGQIGHVTADRQLALLTAATCKEVALRVGDLANFRFCAAFHCPPNIPFFPVAYHIGQEPVVTVGLENGDLVFLGCFAAKDHENAKSNLADIFRQALLPIQQIVEQACNALGVCYGGIDASVNPGLSMPESVAKGLEDLLPAGSTFGAPGTLAIVATITSAIKSLAGNGIKLAGYSGLMLPVMEDLILAQRAAAERPAFGIRDLLFFSSVCGVGIDTVPIPGDFVSAELAAIYEDVAAMAFRLNKPLTCRVLPMAGKKAGELTDVVSPFLCNTKVFALA